MNTTTQTSHAQSAARRILVIEDNFDSAETIQTFLELHGHETAVAHNGKKGLEIAREFSPEVIICDISLSGKIDGYDVAAEVRKDEALRSVFLIALSGYGRPEDKEKARAAGFDVHLVKPPDFDALLELVDSFDQT